MRSAPRYLDAAAIGQALPMAEAIAAARDTFAALARGEVALPQRQVVPLAGTKSKVASKAASVALVMAAAAPGVGAVCKLVSVVPDNPSRGMPRTLGTVQLVDGQTGALEAVLDGTRLTALRTGAASGLATDLLAPRGDACRVAAIIGAGAQARTQLLAIDAVRELDEVRVFGPTPARVEAFIAAMAARVRPRLVAAASAAAAVEGAAIVCTATSSTTPVFSGAALAPEVHVNCVGSFRPDMRELDLDTLRDAAIVVDRREAALEEAGELLAAVDAGLTQPQAWRELGELVLAGALARPASKTVFDSVGLAAQDLFAARRALERARVLSLGLPLT